MAERLARAFFGGGMTTHELLHRHSEQDWRDACSDLEDDCRIFDSEDLELHPHHQVEHGAAGSCCSEGSDTGTQLTAVDWSPAGGKNVADDDGSGRPAEVGEALAADFPLDGALKFGRRGCTRDREVGAVSRGGRALFVVDPLVEAPPPRLRPADGDTDNGWNGGGGGRSAISDGGAVMMAGGRDVQSPRRDADRASGARRGYRIGGSANEAEGGEDMHAAGGGGRGRSASQSGGQRGGGRAAYHHNYHSPPWKEERSHDFEVPSAAMPVPSTHALRLKPASSHLSSSTSTNPAAAHPVHTTALLPQSRPRSTSSTPLSNSPRPDASGAPPQRALHPFGGNPGSRHPLLTSSQQQNLLSTATMHANNQPTTSHNTTTSSGQPSPRDGPGRTYHSNAPPGLPSTFAGDRVYNSRPPPGQSAQQVATRASSVASGRPVAAAGPRQGTSALAAQAGKRQSGICFLLVVLHVIAFEYVSYTWFLLMPLLFPEPSASGIFVAIVFHIFFGLTVWSFAQCVVTDPGTVPPNWGFYMGDKNKRRRYCQVCNIWKPDRTHHCSACGRCVLNMDHHCPWINNCVGFFNRKFFIQLLCYALVTCVFAATHGLVYVFQKGFLIWPYSHSNRLHHRESELDFALDVGAYVCVCIMLFIAVALAFPLFPFLKFHLGLILNNSTTIMMLDQRPANERSRYDLGSRFDLGSRRNLEQVLGASLCLWWLPVHTSASRPVGDGVRWKQYYLFAET